MRQLGGTQETIEDQFGAKTVGPDVTLRTEMPAHSSGFLSAAHEILEDDDVRVAAEARRELGWVSHAEMTNEIGFYDGEDG